MNENINNGQHQWGDEIDENTSWIERNILRTGALAAIVYLILLVLYLQSKEDILSQLAERGYDFDDISKPVVYWGCVCWIVTIFIICYIEDRAKDGGTTRWAHLTLINILSFICFSSAAITFFNVFASKENQRELSETYTTCTIVEYRFKGKKSVIKFAIDGKKVEKRIYGDIEKYNIGNVILVSYRICKPDRIVANEIELLECLTADDVETLKRNNQGKNLTPEDWRTAQKKKKETLEGKERIPTEQ